MGALRLTIALLVTLAALSPSSASARTHRHKRHCALPRGWRVVARDSQAIVIATSNPRLIDHAGASNPNTQVTEEWRYCVRAAGGFHTLMESTIDGGGMSVSTFSTPVLAGPYVAYGNTDDTGGGRMDYPTYGTVYLRNLRTGVQHFQDLGQDCAAPRVLSPTGVVAWIETSCVQPATTFPGSPVLIRTLGKRGNSAVLDQAARQSLRDQPLANLGLYQCVAGCSPRGSTFAWWTHDGVWRSARVG